MRLQPGTSVGSYEIIGTLGIGGMGEVYRARDRRLNRDVAIKVLPALFASDQDRLARFEREAQTLAALNHPHIAQIYGLIDLPSSSLAASRALVMECVEGEDLAQRIERGRLPVDEAHEIARQIADGLEAAHERGIVHRDLKPANVKVTPDGTVKVLDFGLAVGAGAADKPPLADSPTFTSPAIATQAGVILGTAAYMAPEQARGKAVDRRADIWAFGCVLFEMLSGGRPFDGDNMTDVLSAIVSREPDWARLPAATPAVLRGLLVRCLEKDPRRRLRDIGEARLVLEQRADAALLSVQTAPARTTTSRVVPVLSVLTALLATTLLVILAGSRTDTTSAVPLAITRYDVQLPDKATINIVFRPSLAVAADGSTLAFAGVTEGVNRIFVRTRSDVAVRAVEGSERGVNPALSPDGRTVVYFADGALRMASIDGASSTLRQVRDVRGITWADASTLIFSGDSGAPLSRMSSAGGEAQPVTVLVGAERTHRWPDALPGGKAVLFTVGTLDNPDFYDEGNIDAVILATGERRVVIKGAAMARSCGGGQIIYSRGTSLYAVPFDRDRLETTGAPVEVVQGIERDASTGAAHFDCGDDGTLTFVPGSSSGDMTLAWRDREGRSQPVALPPGRYQEARVSPDGARIALLRGTIGAGDVWIFDVAAGTFTRLTFTGDCTGPSWSADGRYVYYTTFDVPAARSIVTRKIADGSREAEPLRDLSGRGYVEAVDESRGTAMVVSVVGNDRGDISRVPLTSAGQAQPLIATPFNEYAASASPDGRWLAYQSDETGSSEIYVLDLAGSGARRQLTSAGGEEPHWSADGRELYYRSAVRLMAVPVESGDVFRAGSPRPLFDGLYNSGIESGRSYDVDRKTGRFLLVIRAGDGRAAGGMRVVLNWDAALAASKGDSR